MTALDEKARREAHAVLATLGLGLGCVTGDKPCGPLCDAVTALYIAAYREGVRENTAAVENRMYRSMWEAGMLDALCIAGVYTTGQDAEDAIRKAIDRKRATWAARAAEAAAQAKEQE